MRKTSMTKVAAAAMAAAMMLTACGGGNAATATTAAPAANGAAAVAVEAKTEAATDASAKEKFRAFKYADHEKHAMSEAIATGQHAYGITVYIQETCILKAARAFLESKI